MRIGKTKVVAGAVLVILTLFFLLGKESKGQEFVPVRDAEVINLLKQLVKKEYELDPEQRQLAAENLNLATDFIIRTLQAMGRKGDINDTGQLNVFVNNWRNFALEGQYRAEDLWRGLLYIAAKGDGDIPPSLCSHIRESEIFNSLQPTQVNGLIQSGLNRRVDSLKEYYFATECDPIVESNYNAFTQDFIQGGGWDMWERLLQPQNNIYGAINLATDELGRQRQIEEQSDLQEANSGSGYLGRRQCLTSGLAGQCVIWSNVNIPANLAVETLGALVNQNLAFIVTTDEAGEGFGIEINRLIEQIFGELTSMPEPLLPPLPRGGGLCSDKGGTPDYAGNLQIAINAVIADNPNGIADALNTTVNSFTFLNLVARELESAGFNATTSVLNGNSRPNQGGLIAVWTSGDSTMERYEAVNHAGDADRTMRAAAQTEYSGDIPLSCVP